MGLLQLEVTRYKIRHTGTWENVRDYNTQVTRKMLFFFVYISQWRLVTSFCSPVCWILYYVTCSCKRPIGSEIERVVSDQICKTRSSINCIHFEMDFLVSVWNPLAVSAFSSLHLVVQNNAITDSKQFHQFCNYCCWESIRMQESF